MNAENKDSMTHFSVGDEIVVYYNGDIAESYPLQINTVYAITLKTPADRTENNKDCRGWRMPQGISAVKDKKAGVHLSTASAVSQSHISASDK